MTFDEIELLNKYRKMTPKSKRYILRSMELEIRIENGTYPGWEKFMEEVFPASEKEKTNLQVIK